jgi:hypothetical protein
MMATVHSTTGVAPATLLYANQIDLDVSIFTQSSEIPRQIKKISEFTSDMILMQENLIDIAMKRQLDKNLEHIRQGENSSPTEFEINSFVLRNYPKTRMGMLPPTKLHMNLKGPMKVLSFCGAEYKLLNLITNETETCHVKFLRKFHYDPLHTDPTAIALRDRDESVIKAIISHTGQKTKKEGNGILSPMGRRFQRPMVTMERIKK